MLNTVSLPHSSPITSLDYHDCTDDDATVTTSNTSGSWSSVPSYSGHSAHCNSQTALTATPVTHANFYEALDDDGDYDFNFDDDPHCPNTAVDSGASDNFGDINAPGTNRRPVTTGVTMASATGDCRSSIGLDEFDLPLPKASLEYHVFKRGEVQRPLLSVGKVCDAGCSVIFDAGHCYFIKDRRLLLKGARDPRTGLYLLPHMPHTPKPAYGVSLSQPYHHRAHDAFTVPKLLSYLHGCAGFPVTSTWIQAI